MGTTGANVEPEVMEALIDLFRTNGYEGTSLSQIIAATGLVKASLYHRFPGGKEEMALAVIDWIAQSFAGHILTPLAGVGPPLEKLALTAARIKAFYASGAKACLLDTMSFAVNNRIREHARNALQYWIDSFAKFAHSNGFPEPLARLRAEESVAAIEGALVVARLSGNRLVLQRALDALPRQLIRSSPERGPEVDGDTNH